MLQDDPMIAFHAMMALMAKTESWSLLFKSGSVGRSYRCDLWSGLWGLKPIQSLLWWWLKRPMKLVKDSEPIWTHIHTYFSHHLFPVYLSAFLIFRSNKRLYLEKVDKVNFSSSQMEDMTKLFGLKLNVKREQQRHSTYFIRAVKDWAVNQSGLKSEANTEMAKLFFQTPLGSRKKKKKSVSVASIVKLLNLTTEINMFPTWFKNSFKPISWQL